MTRSGRGHHVVLPAMNTLAIYAAGTVRRPRGWVHGHWGTHPSGITDHRVKSARAARFRHTPDDVGALGRTLAAYCGTGDSVRPGSW